jgi:Cyclic nucleotide-binding domain/Major Facilitator Superfamily
MPERTAPALPSALLAAVAAFHNHAIRRVLFAFVGFSLAEWSSWIAILVFAYRQGGAAEAGVVALLQLAPSALVAPIGASLGDRVRRDYALRVAYTVQAASMAAAAAALLLGAPNWVIYPAAVVVATSITLTRPVQAAILPALARTPAELTAANVAAGTLETMAILVGPILAGVALAATSPGLVFSGSAALALVAALLVVGVRVAPNTYAGDAHPDEAVPVVGLRRIVRDTIDGFRMLATEERPRAVVSLLGAAAVLWGVLDVLLVILAIDVLQIGEAGVGYLNAAMGAGGLVGAAISVSLVGRHRLAVPFGLGMLLWSLSLAAIGVLPAPLTAFGLLALAGVGRLLLDVAGRTLLQRVAPERMLARVFGVLEGIDMAGLALGSIAAPVLVALVGSTGAFILGGTALSLVTVASWPMLRRADAAGIARPREIELLRGIAMFAPLPPPVIERMAANLLPVHASAGEPVIRQGSHGDRFYIITAGGVEVRIDGRVVREEGPGDSFGEIALLRNVPRTATVIALDEVALVALERRIFLEAITGQPASSAIADATVDDRLRASAYADDAVEQTTDAST